ncbi:hypothetical protein [Microbacterium sp. AG157]|uniref:hypothetical protein n=1 Tax=Microbacterium sp. AG157 TaxID=2183993 RepID=UPI000E2428FD|nr:hypothetical protein [Microbacterium sp. AG157]
MTDEQVQKIVDALAGNPFEPWVAAGIALASALLGFLLSQAAETWRRRQRLSDEVTAAKKVAARDATAWAMQTASLPADMLGDRVDKLPDDLARHIAALQSADEGFEVGQWWVRQMRRVATPPPKGRKDFTPDESSYRWAVAASVSKRLRKWATGEISASAFGVSGDAEWDREMKLPPAGWPEVK